MGASPKDIYSVDYGAHPYFRIAGRPIFLQQVTANALDTIEAEQSGTAEGDKGDAGSEVQVEHTERTSLVVWDCSLVLAKYLEYQRQAIPLHAKRVLELGSGQGIVGIAAALLGAQVTLTDVAFAIPALTSVVRLNNLSPVPGSRLAPSDTAGCVTHVRPLDWLHRDDFIHSLESPFDYILASDVVWVDWLIEPLVATIADILQQSHILDADVHTVAYLCHQTRSTRGDERLFKQLELHGLTYQTVDFNSMEPTFRKPGLINIFRVTRAIADKSP
ncbi:hypothetical protein IWQ60_006189 [Tieghemiomyces parasiticus]|uniref:Methyltransferase-domain-containing protein n=1 Tax=Tieghemiomyces parasiticus TaxID=78921 RepID=A0A9W8DY75_9FUNG|nr:hypothetical protein IWQ60_006189 [Tieghemiomyces parasiticus]